MPVAVRSISMSVSASISSSQQARQDGLDVPGEGADEHQSVEPHVTRNTNKASICRIHVRLQVVVFSNSSIRFMSSVVVISMASRRRPSRPCSPPPSPSPTCTQARSTQSAVWGHEKSADPRSGRIERPSTCTTSTCTNVPTVVQLYQLLPSTCTNVPTIGTVSPLAQ